jgi:hypothetical protein
LIELHATPIQNFLPIPESGSNRIDSFKSISLRQSIHHQKVPVSNRLAGRQCPTPPLAATTTMPAVWSDNRIVLSPFTSNAQAGAFVDFSFVNPWHLQRLRRQF